MPMVRYRFRPYFYPRPPHGGRPAQLKKRQTIREFLSTPSARRATLAPESYSVAGPISIHALREEGDVIDGNNAVSYEISIHALREEGDTTPARPA